MVPVTVTVLYEDKDGDKVSIVKQEGRFYLSTNCGKVHTAVEIEPINAQCIAAGLVEWSNENAK